MTKLAAAISMADEIRDNVFSNAIKTAWINELEATIQVELLGINKDDIVQYVYVVDSETELIANPPYDRIYQLYLYAMIEFAQKEYSDYQNSMNLFNAAYLDYCKWYQRTYGSKCQADGGFYISAYGLAMKHGYGGTETEWLASLKGATGKPGKGFVVLGFFADLAALQAAITAPEIGDSYGIGDAEPYVIYIWDGSAWVDNGTLQGPEGLPGAAATVAVGTTGTGEAGTSAQVTNSGTSLAAVLDFIIPRGSTGAAGADGREVEFQKTATHIQWRYVGGDWANLVALAEIKGNTGDTGPASTVPGPPGTDGYTPVKGVDYFDGTDGADGEDGKGITSITRTSGNGAAGTTDTYTITYSDATTSTFSVYNGADGVGTGDMLASVYADSPGVVKDAAKFGGQLPAHYAKATDIPDISGKVDTADLADVATSGSYDDLEDVPDSFTPSPHDHVKANITDFPSSMAPTAHKSTHASGGGDALSPADIGAQAAITASGILKGNGSAVSAATAGTDYVAPSALDSYLPRTIEIVTVTANLTLSASHNGKHLWCTNSSAITITIPSGLGAGFNCTAVRRGAGDVGLTPSGVTLNGASSSLTLGDQYEAAVSIIAGEANVFGVNGGLA